MTKWKKNAKEFSVSVHYDERRGTIIIVPKPVVDFLKEPDRLKFEIVGKKIIVSGE